MQAEVDDVLRYQAYLQVLWCNGIIEEEHYFKAHKNLERRAKKEGIHFSCDHEETRKRIKT